MTLAHSSRPCSQMCRYSCPWTTPPCTSLSLLTWGCPCVDWRFSTNHWPLQPLAFWPLPPTTLLYPPSTTSSSPTFPAPPLPVCGRLEHDSLSASSSHHNCLPSPFWLVRRQRISFCSLFKKCLHLHVFFFFCLFSLLFIYFTAGLIWWVKMDSSLWCWFKKKPPLLPLCHPNHSKKGDILDDANTAAKK